MLERVRVYVLFSFVFSLSEIEKSYVCVTVSVHTAVHCQKKKKKRRRRRSVYFGSLLDFDRV